MVFDKESNHMMQVYLDYQKCVINHQPMLPVNPKSNSGLFENFKVAEEENTYESPIDGLTKNRLVEKVSLEVYVKLTLLILTQYLSHLFLQSFKSIAPPPSLCTKLIWLTHKELLQRTPMTLVETLLP